MSREKGIVIYGPKACGKTRNKDLLLKFTGYKKIIDDWSFSESMAPETLHLTNEEPPKGFRRVISFELAMEMAKS